MTRSENLPKSLFSMLAWLSAGLNLGCILFRVWADPLDINLKFYHRGFYNIFWGNTNALTALAGTRWFFLCYTVLFSLYVYWQEFKAWAFFRAGQTEPDRPWFRIPSLITLAMWFSLWILLHILEKLGWADLSIAGDNRIMFLVSSIWFSLVLSLLQIISEWNLRRLRLLRDRTDPKEVEKIKQAMLSMFRFSWLEVLALAVSKPGKTRDTTAMTGPGTKTRTQDRPVPGPPRPEAGTGSVVETTASLDGETGQPMPSEDAQEQNFSSNQERVRAYLDQKKEGAMT